MLIIQSTLIMIAEEDMTQRQIEEEPWRAPGHGRPGTPHPAPATTYHPLSAASPNEPAQVSSTSSPIVPPVRLRRVRPQRPVREIEEEDYEVDYQPPPMPATVRHQLPVRPAVLPPTVPRQGRAARVPESENFPRDRYYQICECNHCLWLQ